MLAYQNPYSNSLQVFCTQYLTNSTNRFIHSGLRTRFVICTKIFHQTSERSHMSIHRCRWGLAMSTIRWWLYDVMYDSHFRYRWCAILYQIKRNRDGDKLQWRIWGGVGGGCFRCGRNHEVKLSLVSLDFFHTPFHATPFTCWTC